MAKSESGPSREKFTRNASAKTISDLKELNKALAQEINMYMDRAAYAEAMLEQAIGFIRWSKQFAPFGEPTDAYHHALNVLAGDPIPESEKPAEIVNERIIVR